MLFSAPYACYFASYSNYPATCRFFRSSYLTTHYSLLKTLSSYAILPAAGRSVRMGAPKLLLPWHSGTILSAVLAAWRASRVDRVVAVVHSDDDEIAAICRAAGAQVVLPADPPAEMKHSVALGLAWIEDHLQPTPDSAWLLAPADMPDLSTAVIDALIAAHDSANDAAHSQIIVPVSGSRRGHPVLFPWSLAAAVPQLTPSEGVNALLARMAVRELQVAPQSIPADINTPEDYARLHKR